MSYFVTTMFFYDNTSGFLFSSQNTELNAKTYLFLTVAFLLDSSVSLTLLGRDRRCEGFSGADMSALVREASMAALKEALRSTVRPSIAVGSKHFEQAFREPAENKHLLLFFLLFPELFINVYWIRDEVL